MTAIMIVFIVADNVTIWCVLTPVDCFRVALSHHGPVGEVFPVCLVERRLQQCVSSQPHGK